VTKASDFIQQYRYSKFILLVSVWFTRSYLNIRLCCNLWVTAFDDPLFKTPYKLQRTNDKNPKGSRSLFMYRVTVWYSGKIKKQDNRKIFRYRNISLGADAPRARAKHSKNVRRREKSKRANKNTECSCAHKHKLSTKITKCAKCCCDVKIAEKYRTANSNGYILLSRQGSG
jgi:hypothetical protein